MSIANSSKEPSQNYVSPWEWQFNTTQVIVFRGHGFLHATKEIGKSSRNFTPLLLSSRNKITISQKY